jgi:hypothetical protein
MNTLLLCKKSNSSQFAILQHPPLPKKKELKIAVYLGGCITLTSIYIVRVTTIQRDFMYFMLLTNKRESPFELCFVNLNKSKK